MATPLRITVWNENVHERTHPAVTKIYPDGIHGAIKAGLEEKAGDGAITVRMATQEQPEHGLTEEVLAATDVLFWWGHCAHDKVEDAIVERVADHVLQGMGLIVLHSGHFSKIFKRLMGTPCALKWREAGEVERVWTLNPGHPIAQGLEGEYFELPHEEMYGEPFSIPNPEEQVFISWFEGGEVFRSGCVWRRGAGTIFYFRPGHETYPTYYDANVRTVLYNAAQYVAPRAERTTFFRKAPNVPADKAPVPLEVTGDSVH